MDLVRCAGVPTVEVLGVGVDGQLPGGRWMITDAAPGRKLEQVGLQTPTIARTLADLAECYTRLHRVRCPASARWPTTHRAARSAAGHSGRGWRSRRPWSLWKHADVVPPGFRDGHAPSVRRSRARLDRAPGALLNAEVGDGETFVDPATGAVTAIVDWGSALVGDPLYDIARFVAGGPADDPRPALVLPRLHAEYFARNAYDPDHARRMLRFYRFHICVVEAAWGQELGWTPSLVAWAEQLLDELGH